MTQDAYAKSIGRWICVVSLSAKEKISSARLELPMELDPTRRIEAN
jgi:hypothetical protein